MSDTDIMVMELAAAGYSCAQILLAGALRLQGREEPDIIRCMSGLAQGGGCSGELCGALSGGMCLIGLYCGKGSAGEEALPHGPVLMESLLSWFREQPFAARGVTCEAVLGQEGCAMDQELCGRIVAGVFDQCLRLLIEEGIDPSEGREAV